MNRALSFSSLAVCAALGPLAVAACSSTDRGFRVDPEEPPFVEQDSGPPPVPPACGRHCSRDLKKVLDGCEGSEKVVAECSVDQGCAIDTCVDACTAAAVNKGSPGCDFYTVPPADPSTYKGSCFAALIANTWDRPVTLSAEFGTASLDISRSIYTVSRKEDGEDYTLLDGALPPGEVAVVFLSHNEASQSSQTMLCPTTVHPAMLVDPLRYGTTKTTAFRLKADAPIAAYTIYPYGGAESYYPTATLLLPVTAWNTGYIAVSPYDYGAFGKPRTLQIIASEDDTDVSIRPTVEVAAGAGVAGATTGVTQTWKLQRGQTLQFAQAAMTGSPIVSTKPVGVFGGSTCTFIMAQYCDLLQQQIPPFAQWGSEYALVPFKPRLASFSDQIREKTPYTLVGAVDGTVLTYEPSRPRNAPETLGAGEVANFITDEIVVVRSQDSKHPFYASVYMTGSTYGNGEGKRTLGDPDFVNVPPADQFLDRYVFFTDYTYPETNLTIVRRKTAKGFAPVELECGGEVTGWRPVGSSGEYEFAWVTLTTGFVPQKLSTGTCGYGRQEAHSDGPFSITVWGTGIDASYGYVAGMGLRPINDAKVPSVN